MKARVGIFTGLMLILSLLAGSLGHNTAPHVTYAGLASTPVERDTARTPHMSPTLDQTDSHDALLSGDLVSLSGEPLDGLHVWLLGESQRRHTTSDEQGRYTFERLAAGSYHLVIETEAGQRLFVVNERAQTIELEPGARQQVTLEILRPGESAPVRSARSPRQATGSIEGTVTAEDTNAPLDVGVRLLDANGEFVDSVPAMSSGFYAFSDLAPGSYYVEFNPAFSFGPSSSYRLEYYNDAATLAEADLVTVNASETTVVDAQLDLGGQISGTVTAADTGLPLQGVQVYADDDCDPNTSVYQSRGRTDSNGNYTISGLSPGNYAIEFFTRFASQEPTNLYLSEYYNDRPAWPSADTVTITGTVEIDSIDAQLARGAQMSGTVLAEDTGFPLEDVMVWISPVDDSFFISGIETDSNGTYTSNGLPSGQYMVEFDTDGGGLGVGASETYIAEYYDNQTTADTATPVTITAPNMTSSIDAVLSPGGTISGVITAADTNLPLDDVTINVFDTAGNPASSASADSSGNYEVLGLASGNYIIEFVPATYSSSDARDYPFQYYNQQRTFEDGEAVAVTAPGTTTANTALVLGGQISGNVTAADTSEPLEDAAVTAYVVDGENSYVAAQTETDSNGDYTLPTVFVGDYVVGFSTITTAPSENINNYSPEYYDGKNWQTAANGDTVSVTAGNVTSDIDVDLDHGARISGIVTSPEGDPLSDALACIYFSSDEEDRLCLSTNDLGYYGIRWLPGGERRVQFVPPSNRCNVYVPEFYDNKTSFDTADIITTVAPNPTDNINAALPRRVSTYYIPLVAR